MNEKTQSEGRVATSSGKDILLRMLQDIEDLKSSGGRVRAALEAIRDEIEKNAPSFSKLADGLNGLMDALGSVEARVDEHEDRLNALEQGKPS